MASRTVIHGISAVAELKPSVLVVDTWIGAEVIHGISAVAELKP